MSDTLLSPGLSTYSTQQGAEYRIAGVVRGSLTDADAQTALQALGLASLTYYAANATLPSDWPVESLPALGTNERYFRADGIWMQSSPMPTAYTTTNGASLVFYQVWQHSVASQPITLTSNSGAPSLSSNSPNKTLEWVGAAIFFALAGGLVYNAWEGKSSHSEMRENPLTKKDLPKRKKLHKKYIEILDRIDDIRVNHNGYDGVYSSELADLECELQTIKDKLENENPLYQENYLRHVNNRWVLVSKTTGRPLAYYRGSGKPSQAWVSKQERRIQYFKHKENPVSKTKAESRARGAYDLAKMQGSSDRSAHGAAQEAAAKVLGTYDGTYEIADYAEAYWKARKSGQSSASAERIARGVYKNNPVQYHSSFKVHGVPVHMHFQDGKFCADYRAVDKYAPGKGGVVCGRTEADAEDRARDAVAAALIQARRLVGGAAKPKLYPSPWD